MAGESYRGRIMYRVTRPDRQAYIARAVLANNTYVEAIFDTDDHLQIDGAQRCEINDSTVTVNGVLYALTSHAIRQRGETTMEPPPTECVEELSARCAMYGLTAFFTNESHGLWVLRVQTPRGEIEVPVIPGDRWPQILELAGLGATVCV